MTFQYEFSLNFKVFDETKKERKMKRKNTIKSGREGGKERKKISFSKNKNFM